MQTGHSPLREWQVKARDQLLQVWRSTPKYKALIAGCPGSGKTQCAVDIADQILRDGHVALALVLSPTVNIQLQWVKAFAAYGINATCQAQNEALRWRREAGQTMIEDKAAIVITYYQLARDPDLFAELVRRHNTFLIADEVHHADDEASFGEAIGKLVDEIVHSLALSGTPFNSVGGALALCESTQGLDHDGQVIRTTIASYGYSYGEAIIDDVCRPVEFAKVSGHAQVTYKSLLDGKIMQRLVKTSRKSDRIGLLLSPSGEYVREMMREGLRVLTKMRETGDRRAAMLIVAKSIPHGGDLIKVLDEIRDENPEWAQFSNIQEIYNDTPRAHDRIEALVKDNTDIVVSVKMLSEGVDVQRLRVGIYATDIMTRMFFIQFVGRFIRFETRLALDQLQYAVVIIPAHPHLLTWAREIEKMVLISQIALSGGGDPPPDPKNEFIGINTEAQGISHTFRGEETAENLGAVIHMMYEKSSVFKGMPDVLVIKAANDLGYSYNDVKSTYDGASNINWSKRNDNLVAQIVRLLQQLGYDETTGELFKKVNGSANQHVGIPRKDPMTSDAILEARYHFLQNEMRRVLGQTHPELDLNSFDAA